MPYFMDGPGDSYNPNKTGLYRDWTSNDTFKAGAILAVIVLIVVLVFSYLNTGDQYTMQVKVIEWRYVIHLQTYRKVHEFGYQTPPQGAYNVTSKMKERFDDDWQRWYEYDVNRWVRGRSVASQGTDKEPYWKEYELYISNDPSGLGNEREGSREKIYTISGTIRGAKNDNLKSVQVSEDIWLNCKLTDELVFMQSKIGKPYDIHIAE